MISNLTRNWWLVGLRGLLAIAFGLIAWVWPGITLQALIFLLGIYFIADGIASIAMALSPLGRAQWGWLLFKGIFSIAAGVVVFVWPGLTAVALLAMVAAYAFILGVIEIVSAFQFDLSTADKWLMGLTGVLSIVYSVLLLVWPNSGLLSLVWMVGFYAVLYGFTLLALSYRLNKLNNTVKSPASQVPV